MPHLDARTMALPKFKSEEANTSTKESFDALIEQLLNMQNETENRQGDAPLLLMMPSLGLEPSVPAENPKQNAQDQLEAQQQPINAQIDVEERKQSEEEIK